MLKYISLYLILINFSAFLLMHIDKRKAQKKEWRISENNLMLTSMLGGSIGMLLGMYTFHHKTKHVKFTLGLPTILIIQLVLVFYYTL